jgi:hypothetical protein
MSLSNSLMKPAWFSSGVLVSDSVRLKRFISVFLVLACLPNSGGRVIGGGAECSLFVFDL